MYTTTNFKTKKALKEAVASGESICVYQPNDLLGRDFTTFTGSVFLEGPHYPAPHTWYAQADVRDGIITRVK